MTRRRYRVAALHLQRIYNVKNDKIRDSWWRKVLRNICFRTLTTPMCLKNPQFRCFYSYYLITHVQWPSKLFTKTMTRYVLLRLSANDYENVSWAEPLALKIFPVIIHKALEMFRVFYYVCTPNPLDIMRWLPLT